MILTLMMIDDLGCHENLATDHDVSHDDVDDDDVDDCIYDHINIDDDDDHDIYNQGPTACFAGRWQRRLCPHLSHIDLI